jgi:XTP/dITP diphosphohydrolase
VDKAREISRILEPYRITVETLDDADIHETPDEETIESFPTFTGNALAKACFFAARTAAPVLADDSGIEVAALDDAPGVRSRRFAGRGDLRGADLDRANNDALLARLAGIAPEHRKARYVCAAVAVFPDGRRFLAVGVVSGRILDAPAGAGGFGYDPLFFLPEQGCTFGQLDPDAKNRISHRARAFRALAACIS